MKTKFSYFTKILSQTKTLRFELKPTSLTEQLMEKNNIIKIDKEIERLYQEEMKPLLDELHGRFITESLQQAIFTQKELREYLLVVKEYRSAILDTQKDYEYLDKLRKKVESSSNELRKAVGKSFTETGKVWKNKYSKDIKLTKQGYALLIEKSALDLLQLEFPEKREMIEKNFKGFWTYFSGYNENRKNFYATEAKSTAVASRVVDENLSRYIDNIISFNRIRKEIPELEKLTEDFSIESYNSYLDQVGIDKYNKIVGGYVNMDGEKIQGVNEKVNLYRQQDKNSKLPKLKLLYKQIGSNREPIEILTIEEGDEWGRLQELFNLQNKQITIDSVEVSVFNALKETLKTLFRQLRGEADGVFDLEKIYFNKISINTISNSWFVNWQKLAELLDSDKRLKKSTDGNPRIPPQVTLGEIKAALVSVENKEKILESIFRTTDREKNDRSQYFKKNAWITFLNIWESEWEKNFAKLTLLEEGFPEWKKKNFDRKSKEQKHFIKDVCDQMLAIERMVKYHIPKDANLPLDTDFYMLVDYFAENRDIIDYYNAFRNYISKKPYTKDKVKLNFGNGILLQGWSDGQEKNKSGVILRRGDDCYLGILVKRSLFRNDTENNEIYRNDDSGFERLILSNLKFQTLAGKGFISKYGQKYSEMDKEAAIECLQEFIIEKYVQKYPALKEVAYGKFKDKKEFDSKVKECLKKSFSMEFVPISKQVLDASEQEGDIYLFKITNKDLSSNKQHRENIHTTYWRELFSERNLAEPVLALNGGAEVFYRDGQSEKLERKLDKNGKEVLDARRYADDKLFFHVPIAINHDKPSVVKFNEIVNTYIAGNDVNVVGIDRGEKHLIYFSVINSKGDILEQGSLNKLRLGNQTVDFNQKLSERADNMMEARKSWQEIGTIRNFKEGYLSHVVHEIYQLMLKHNAVIVLEDLNTEFKAKRGAKVEKSVYKKFELALAKKLSHLIIKDSNAVEPGGALNAYQLVPPVTKVGLFEKAKQWGVMFYVRANYTSTTDPVTGWRKHLYISNSATQESIKSFFNPETQDSVTVFYSDTLNTWGFRYKHKPTSKVWELFAKEGLERFRFNIHDRKVERIDIYSELKEVMQDIDSSKEVYEQMLSSKSFNWKRLVFLWNMLNQIRNTNRDKEGNENDFIQSPAYPFYDSRSVNQGQNLPDNGDANGAYNTARKGLILLERIKVSPEKYSQLVKDEDWDNFAIKSNAR